MDLTDFTEPMTLTEYQLQAARTAKRGDFEFDLIHVALGATGEAGELADAIKRFAIYRHGLDGQHVLEELGDLLWFVALGCTVMGVTLDEVAEANIAKLRRRYPDRYSDALAAARLDKEGCA